MEGEGSSRGLFGERKAVGAVMALLLIIGIRGRIGSLVRCYEGRKEFLKDRLQRLYRYHPFSTTEWVPLPQNTVRRFIVLTYNYKQGEE